MTPLPPDHDVVAVQIERRPRSQVEVVRRCHLGLPVAIAVPPLLDDGTPFPTRYWLTCPLAVRRISRIESSGGVRRAEERLHAHTYLARRHEEATARYAAERDGGVPSGWEGPRPSGGVGGAGRGVKCLHAHYADHAAGNDNPTGEWTAGQIEPLDCIEPCVAEIDGAVVHNPQWIEPQLP